MPFYSKENVGFVTTKKEESGFVKKDIELPLNEKKATFSVLKRTHKFGRKRLQNLSKGRELMKKFQRMKTFHGHGIPTEHALPVSVIEFDLTNKFIITASDDKLVKVWLTLNGSLQGTLVGHTNFIVDLKVSYCNRYIVSCGKEGVIHIWDLKKLTHLYKCDEHKGSVNSIKVIQTKLLNTEAQLLYSGSDDGLINVYNLDKIENPN